MSVVTIVSYNGFTSSGVVFAKDAAYNCRSISFKQGNKSWSAKMGNE